MGAHLQTAVEYIDDETLSHFDVCPGLHYFACVDPGLRRCLQMLALEYAFHSQNALLPFFHGALLCCGILAFCLKAVLNLQSLK